MYKKLNIDGTDFFYFKFNNLSSFTDFVNKEQLNDHNSDIWNKVKDSVKDKKDGWYGNIVKPTLNQLQNHVTYQNMNLVNEAKNTLRNKLKPKLDKIQKQIQDSKSIKFNAKGLGIFSFARASMGLHRFSKLKTNTPIERLVTGLDIELGRNKAKTYTKDVFAYFVAKPTQRKAVTIFVNCGGMSNVDGKNMVYNGVGIATVVEILEKKGIAVQIKVLLSTKVESKNFISEITIKKHEDTLDINLLMLLSADPAYFRYKGFKGLIAMSNHAESNITRGLGTTSDYEKFVNQNEAYKNQTNIVFGEQYTLHDVEQKTLEIINQF